MGRHSTFPDTTDSAKRIELSYLQKQGLIKEGCKITSTLNWSNRGKPSGSISIESNFEAEEPYIRLYYTSTDRATGKKEEINYQIRLERVKSNLGRGHRLYFVCPFTNLRCTILYSPGSTYFAHRNAFKNMFYDSQLIPKSMGPFMVLEYERRARELRESKTKNGRRINSQYRGQPTKFQKRLNRLENKAY